jgi:FkbM family methyltransferase
MPTGRLGPYTQRFAMYLQEVMHSAWQIARTPRERVEAVRFLLTFLAVKMGYRLARSLPPDLTLRVRGLTWHVGVHATELPVLGEVYIHRVYDRHPDFVPCRGWTVVDVGANVGAYTLLQARRGAHVIAIEPNPSVYHSLCRAVAANGMGTQVDTLHAALSESEGWGVVRMPDRSTPTGMVVPLTPEATGGGPAVYCCTLDLLRRERGLAHIDLLKIDAEGAEASILRGGMQTLSQVARIQVEYHNENLRHEVEALLHETGFTVVHHVAQTNDIGILYACRRTAHDGVRGEW